VAEALSIRPSGGQLARIETPAPILLEGHPGEQAEERGSRASPLPIDTRTIPIDTRTIPIDTRTIAQGSVGALVRALSSVSSRAATRTGATAPNTYPDE
jgi:hypothetical protein